MNAAAPSSRRRPRFRGRAPALLLALAGSVQAQLPAPVAVPDTIAQRVLACTACHGKEGRASNQGYFPRIAGKPADYLFNQLVNFRDGRRHHGLMSYLVQHLSDDYLMEMARHFAALDLPYPPPQTRDAPAALLARGEALVRQGDASRRIPACAQCHGAALTGVQPAIPGLLGLPRDYLNGQLGAWQTGQRRAHAPDCMAQVARQLSPQDIGAISTWLSSQPLPADAKPAAALQAPMPLRCGGVAEAAR
ncbi:c-type cytochrome [Caldimonas tepidiphila]|uniref:c-type cytochrome n=1 Tax=Caldimonas tepidiphila TaxID=2315841 RepID=UPI000E5A1D31|nr:c-type cytochrome [Caldimonas tepidiphila]